MKKLLVLVFALMFSSQASSLIISVSDLTGSLIAPGGTPPPVPTGVFASIIAAPASATNAAVTNMAQQGFNEKQGVFLSSAVAVDSGFLPTDIVVNSQMIFLNIAATDGTIVGNGGVNWTFDGAILGVMSDFSGALENLSTSLFGAPGTTYPGSGFGARGMEVNDGYTIAGSVLTVNMTVSQPGDWIRVITQATSVPEPATLFLLGLGLLGMGASRRLLTRH
jgi:PEP-CTERM motif